MVSVVIAAYNCAAWIERVVQDVLDQTLSDFELIVVDDGSTDATADVVRAIHDPRIRFVRQEGSGSPAKPRNTGLAMARGEFVAFLDHDDRWVPERLEKVIACLQVDPSVDAVCHDQWVVQEGKRIRANLHGPASLRLYLDMLLGGNRVSTSAVTLRTERVRELGGFNESREFFTVEDFDLWLRLAQKGRKFHFLHEFLGEYTIHGTNMTGNRERHHQAKRALALHHVAQNPELLRPFAHRILAHCDLALARDLHSRSEFRDALPKYREAWKGGCRTPKVCAGALLALMRIRA